MSKKIRIILMFVGIALFVSLMYFGLNSTNDSRSIQVEIAQDGGLETEDDFDKTWGGPGNRHPAFLGWDIPKVCTQDMIKYLVKYSSMFDVREPYASPLDGDPGIGANPEYFVQCENELLEIRENRK